MTSLGDVPNPYKSLIFVFRPTQNENLREILWNFRVGEGMKKISGKFEKKRKSAGEIS